MNTARWSRRLWAAAFVSNAAWIGFVTTIMLASRIDGERNPDGQMPLISYGMGGALFATVAAAIFSTVARPKLLRPVAIVTLLIAGGLAVYVASV
jgi:glucan phosphoethanolaminetransferase (alkaline phosphatase superfamily)